MPKPDRLPYHQQYGVSKRPFYGYFLDKKGQWFDSHKIGVNGPMFHFSDANRKVLHLWLLSFERHALVGHYAVNLK